MKNEDTQVLEKMLKNIYECKQYACSGNNAV